MNSKIVLTLCVCLYSTSAQGFWPFTKSYEQLQPADLVKRLQSEQVDSPDDPQLNYNLGVALYKTKKLDEAKENFKRAYIHATKYPELAQRSIFNAGAMAYKGSLALLPDNWEKEDTKVDQKILEQALKEAEESVAHFQTLLKDNPEHEHGKAFKALADELVKKLRKKIEQSKQDEKNDQQNKDDKKDDKSDSKDKQNEQNGGQDQKQGGNDKADGDSKKQDKGDGKQSSSGDKEKGQDKGDQSGKDQQSQGKDDVNDRQQKGDKDQGQGDGKQDSDKSREQGTGGQDKKPENKDGGKDKQAERNDHESTPQEGQNASGQEQPEAAETDGTPGQAGMQENEGPEQAVAGQEQEDAQSKALRAMLEHVQSDESKAQKRMMLRKMQQGQQPVGEGQKTW